MNIAMVSEHASPLAVLGGVDAGGQNVHVAALAETMVRLGHSVTVYTRRDAPSLPARVRTASGVVVVHIDAGPPRTIGKDAIYEHVPAFAAALERLWRRAAPDIVHSHFWMSALAALGPARTLGIPLVHTFHALGIEKRRYQGLADTSPGARIAAEERIARNADRIIATSRAEVFELLRMGAAARCVKVVPCGVDVERFVPHGPRERRNARTFRVITISRLVPRKGVDSVIEAIADVPSAELVVAGGGESADLALDAEARRLTALAIEAGTAARTFFRGRVERADVPALLRSADAIVCAPWYEPFGIVPLEAMACGVPVVVSAVGGLVDTVVDGVTGFHVAPRAPLQIAAALETLRSDDRARRDMGKRGVERVAARYSWHRVATDTLAVYAGTIGIVPSILAAGT